MKVSRLPAALAYKLIRRGCSPADLATQLWDRRIVPPIFVWMPESGAADIALDAELDAPQRVRGCAKLPIFRYKTVKNSKKRP